MELVRMEKCKNNHGGICSCRASGFQNFCCPYVGKEEKCRFGITELPGHCITEYSISITEEDIKACGYKIVGLELAKW